MILITHILSYIQSHWTAWLFAMLGLAFGYLFRKLEKQQAESRAVGVGVQSLLRENIVANYNKYQEKGYCPIYAKESISHVYEAYHNLGGMMWQHDCTSLFWKCLRNRKKTGSDRYDFKNFR